MTIKHSDSCKNKIRLVFTLLLVVILIINIIVSAFIFLDIQVMEMPETTIKVDLIEINSEEIIIHHSIEIYNPNQFEIIADNFEVVANTIYGDEIARLKIDGGCIPSQTNRTFESSDRIAFNDQGYSTIISKITGTVGVKFLGLIKKTLPVSINVITSVGDVIQDISAPIFHIEADFGEITQEGINFTGTIDVYNPNPFDMYVEDFSIEIETETGKIVGNLDVTGGTISAKSSQNLYSTGRILIEVIDAKTLIINMSSTAGVKIAGINKSIPFSIDAHLNIPRLEDILSSDTPTEVIIKLDMKATLRGFISNMTLEINNPNKIGLIARDIVFLIYRIDKDEKKLIGKSNIGGAEVGPENTTDISTQILLPYSKLFFSRGKRFLPDALLVIVRTNITISGLNQHIWIGVSGYQDMRPFS